MRPVAIITTVVAAAVTIVQSSIGAAAAVHSSPPVTRVVINAPHIRPATHTVGWTDPRYRAAISAGALQVVYVSQLLNGTVLAYPTNTATPPTAPVEVISGLTDPQGLAVDPQGNVYVGELNDVKVFAPGSTTPQRTLTGVSLVDNVAVDTHGTVYVLTSQATAAKIFVYRNGATTPSYTLTDPSIDIVLDLAVDATGNIFLIYIDTSFILRVGAFTSLGPLLVPLQVDANGPPFSLALDKFGDLLVDSASPNPAIGIYPPATQTATQSVTVATSSHGRALFAVSSGDHHLFVAPQNDGILTEYGYPTGGLQRSITLPKFASASGPLTDFTTGIAVTPVSPVGTW